MTVSLYLTGRFVWTHLLDNWIVGKLWFIRWAGSLERCGDLHTAQDHYEWWVMLGQNRVMTDDGATCGIF